MENKYELINVTLYDPTKALFGSSKSDKAEVTKFYCKNKDACGLYKIGQCMNVANFLKPSCLYGKKAKETGFTRRAGKFYSWIKEKKETYADKLYLLNGSKNCFAFIGEYVVLPYAHMNMNPDLPFERKSSLFDRGMPFIKKELFTSDLVIKLIGQRPQAMMGGTIKSYREEQVPKFVNDLYLLYPDMYKEVESKYPRIKEILGDYSYIGRKALIETIKIGSVIKKEKGFGKGSYLWDGEYLISKDYDMSMPFIKYDEIVLKLKPKAKESIKITDNNQVTTGTVFVD